MDTLKFELPPLRFLLFENSKIEDDVFQVIIPVFTNPQVHDYLKEKYKNQEQFSAFLVGYASTEVIQGDWIIIDIDNENDHCIYLFKAHAIEFKTEL